MNCNFRWRILAAILLIILACLPGLAQNNDSREKEDDVTRSGAYEKQLEDYLRHYLVDEYAARSARAWNRDYSSTEAFIRSVAPNRRKWEEVLNPPVLRKSGPLTRTAYPLDGLQTEWIELPLGMIAAQAIQTTHTSLEKPNIIFIVADDLGYNDLGAYGQQLIETPNLDRMAHEGLRFTNFYSGSTVCAPSRCVLMTGQHTGITHVRGNRKGDEPLPDSVVTVAEVLKKAGYATGLVGKWGLGQEHSTGAPNHQGFDYSFGYLSQRHAHNYYPEFLLRNHERVALPNKVRNGTPEGDGVAVEKEVYSHDLILDEALKFLEDHHHEPFFLYFTPTLPHANNEGRDNGMEVPDQGIYRDKAWPESEKNFAAMVSLLDDGVGRLLQKLKDLGIDHRTLVIFTSDNGPHEEGGHKHDFFDSNGALKGKKRDLYEGGIRVPMIARWPGTTEGGQVTDHPGYLGDFMATAATLAGVSPPAHIQSISLVPTLTGNPEAQGIHEYLYWEFYEGKLQQAVRSGKWKAIRKPIFEGTIELYDLEEDQGELMNVADAHPDIVRSMAAMMKAAHTPSPLWNK